MLGFSDYCRNRVYFVTEELLTAVKDDGLIDEVTIWE